MIWNALILALRAIRRNMLRSFLTMLGIVIGVGAVIIMVTIGSGATLEVQRQITSLGSNLIMIRLGQRFGFPATAVPFKIGDVDAILREIDGLNAVAPQAIESLNVIYGSGNWSTSVTGSNNDFFKAGNWTIAQGRLFSDGELRGGMAVCLIGDTIRRELFKNEDPIGLRLRLNKVSCEIIGLLAPKGQSAMGRDQDDTVILPLRTFHRRISGNTDIRTILVSVKDNVSTSKVQNHLEALMRERRHIADNQDSDFHILDTKEIANAQTQTTKILTGLLGSVAAVSLLVGGIGIMNIMLVSVTERTREIGIRLAIGALEREVLLQFLIEAVVLSALGGIFGVIIAIIGSIVIADLVEIPFVFRPEIVIIAFLFSAFVGVVFGYFPARKAARLNPIDALRHE